MSVSSITPSLATTAPAAPAVAATDADSGSIFGDLWDTVNPLQHIPIVSSLYRAATGTSISPVANIAGSTLYGGPIGGAIAAVEEGVSSIGHAIFDMPKTAATQTATAAPVASVQAAKIEPSAGLKTGAVRPSHKMHATTQDWLNQNLADNNQITETADNTVLNTTASNASAAYTKMQSLTKDWLYPATQQAQAATKKTA